jgi:hypothetical protein
MDTPTLPTALALQHYPAAPQLRRHVTSYFSVDEPAELATLAAALPPQRHAVLLFHLGDSWFGALLEVASAQALAEAEGAKGLDDRERLRLTLRYAPSTAFRIVALDRYLTERLVR